MLKISNLSQNRHFCIKTRSIALIFLRIKMFFLKWINLAVPPFILNRNVEKKGKKF